MLVGSFPAFLRRRCEPMKREDSPWLVIYCETSLDKFLSLSFVRELNQEFIKISNHLFYSYKFLLEI